MRGSRHTHDEKDKHTLSIDGRKFVKLTGVNEVKCFDEEEIVFDTKQGMLVLQGVGLHVKRLSLEKGEADVEGHIERLAYSEKVKGVNSGTSVLARIFR